MPETETPTTAIKPTEKATRSLERLRERFGVTALPAGVEVLANSESGVNDLYMNANRQLADGKVEEGTKLLVALAVASALGSKDATTYFSDAAARKGRSEQEIADAISVATVCGIFNGYFRFRHQIPADLQSTYEAFRAPFNANSFMKVSIDQVEVEAICITVSSINNCEKCVEGHINKGKSLGITDEQIDELIRVGAVASAFARVASSLA
ncbi:MAG: carboxymuconolactone decarboxylase family protein [Candidatus Sumerlaeia bacterium]|nr:carboxymuconolactone decarboxylase family protein [Candidatus Sumerlaeia bacterium]